MPNFLKEIRILRSEGKLHRRLLIRVRMLLGIAVVLGGIVVFNVFYKGASVAVVIPLVLMGLALGLFVFSRMTPVQWNDTEEIVEAAKMDTLGYVTLALYIVFEIGFRTFLK